MWPWRQLGYRFPVLFANKRSCPKDALYGIWAQSTVQLQRKFRLTLSAWQTKTNAYANSVDPDETARTHQDLHSLSFGSKSFISDIQMYLIATTNNSLFCWLLYWRLITKIGMGAGEGITNFQLWTVSCILWNKVLVKVLRMVMHWLWLSDKYFWTNNMIPGTLFVLRFYGPVNPMGSCRAWSVYLTTLLLDRSIVHVLSPETDNCSSWISGRERTTVEYISWSKRQIQRNRIPCQIRVNPVCLSSGRFYTYQQVVNGCVQILGQV